jgi:hypothetical protein
MASCAGLIAARVDALRAAYRVALDALLAQFAGA